MGSKAEIAYYYHNDHLGTPQKMTDSSGTVVWSAEYAAFGAATVDPASTVTNNLRLPGQYFDEETGLHYNWNRYYDPVAGRYTQVDPIGFEARDENLYRYSINNPVIISDPTGEIPNVVIGGITSVITGYAIAKLTGDDCYGVKDALIDAGTGAVGAGVFSKLNKLYRVVKLRQIAKARGLQKMAAKGSVETWKSTTNPEWLNIKFKPGIQPGLHPGSNVPRFDLRLAPGNNQGLKSQFWDPFTGQIGPAGDLSHVPLEPMLPVTSSIIGVGAGAGVSAAKSICGCE